MGYKLKKKPEVLRLKDRPEVINRYTRGKRSRRVPEGYVLGIVQIMESRGITQVALSRKTKIPQGYISRLLNGHLIPTIRTASVICNAIGEDVTIEDAFVKQVRDVASETTDAVRR